MSKNKSRHNLSHHKMLTYPMGYNVPTLVRLLTPGDEVTIKATDVFRLEPFQYSIMDTVHAVSSTYYVPLHQLYEGFERFLTGLVTDAPNPVTEQTLKNVIGQLPWFPYAWMPTDDISPAINNSYMDLLKKGWDNGIGLFGYLGAPPPTINNNVTFRNLVRPTARMNVTDALRLNALSFLAYHKIMDDYFRDEEMEYQSIDWPFDIIKHTKLSADTWTPFKSNLMLNPGYWNAIRGWRMDTVSPEDQPHSQRDVGFHLRRCNWEPDFLTTRRPAPQRGESENVSIGADGLFSIDELREATAIQNQKMAQQRSGGRLDDFYRKHYGVSDPSCSFGKCEQIDHESMGLQISDINQTSETTSSSPQGNTVGYSKTVGVGGSTRYTAKCFGILMRITRVLPRTTYHFSIDPMLTMSTQFDFFHEKLEAIGWQPVLASTAKCWITVGDTAQETAQGPTAFNLTRVTGWQPPYESYRRQLSYTYGSFNILNNDAPFYEWTFARDFNGAQDRYWHGEISPSFRQCDPTNNPFALVDSDSPTQVQHYVSYDFQCESIVPYSVNNRCLTH